MRRYLVFYNDHTLEQMQSIIREKRVYIHDKYGSVFLYEIAVLAMFKQDGGVKPSHLLDGSPLTRRMAKQLRGKL